LFEKLFIFDFNIIGKINTKINMEVEKNVSVIVLAAGNSGRMASPKPFLKWDDSLTFIEKIIETYHFYGCNNIILVFNPEVFKLFHQKYPNYKNDYKLKIVINEYPQYERFYSIKKGIAICTNNKFCFIQNVDNPYVNNVILDSLYSNIGTNDYCVPTYKDYGGHPILINSKVINSINNIIENNLKFNEFLSQFHRKNIITEDKTVLYNINTPEEYNKLVNIKKYY